MKQKFIFSLLFLATLSSKAQDKKFVVGPYLKGLTNIKEGYMEVGAELAPSGNFSITPYFRLPLTDKDQNLLVLDRNTSAWKFVTSFRLLHDATTSTSSMKRFYYTGQVEWGYNVFKYYPTGVKDQESKNTKNTVSGEFKFSYFKGAATDKANPEAKQQNYQARIRYTNEYKPSKEVGVVQPPNSMGVTATKNMIIAGPDKTPGISPAIAFQNYRGTGSFSFTNALFYDMTGEKDQDNPINDVHRARYEFWIFFYPVVGDTPNFKVGFGPFVSVRTKGSDDFNKVEYGGQITIKIGDLFQSFF
jgi:hypothetical protein